MIRLQLLGSIDLRDSEGRELRTVLAQPKRLALLAYLAVGSPAGPHRRDTLLGLFWPELDGEHARNALSKAIHFLRRSLGVDALISRNADELAVDPSVIWTDVRAFESALAEGRLEEALELYRGDLLPSFFVPDAPGFEQWLEQERPRLRSRASGAAKLLAERHEAGRHPTLAVASARRAVELSNGDERPLRRLIELLDRLGDRAAAVRSYEEFARKLAAELEVEPAAETVALIERIKASPHPRPIPLTEASDSRGSEPVITRLARAVAGRYKVERQLGAGAMAIVALAHDLRHHRRVAIKVLRPELSSLMGPERFLREIDIAASLMHPHILPLHDSGEADGLLYYVMPYVEGESLRGRLEREPRLPIADALQIGREVADALAYAHHRGFVHRDIKPENILLGVGHALVADFGIARAVGSAGGEQLTTKGLGTGTPAYMSPEQLTGESPVDERTDIYALGCVVYEMLSGDPPLEGTLRPLSELRPDVTPQLHMAIRKALSHAPDDRFRRADEFSAALAQGVNSQRSGEVNSGEEQAGTLPVSFEPRRELAAPGRRRVAAVLIGLSLLLSGVWAYASRRSEPILPKTNPEVIAVLPFRVLGADSLLRGLDEGMVDLLATRLSAGANLHVVDPRTTLAAWRRRVPDRMDNVAQHSLLAIAADLGASRLITGSVVGAAGKVTLAGSLLDVPGGSVRSKANITGDADSLMLLVDRLTAQLLSLDAGEEEHRLAALVSTSLPALREYLEAQAASRRFLFDRARDRFAAAVQIDSTFALAAFGLSLNLQWGNTRYPAELKERAQRLMWTFSHRLSPRDHLRMRAWFGANHPAGTSPAEQIAFVDSALAFIRDDPQLWWSMGDLLLHGGPHLSIPNWRARTTAALHRAIELDSAFLNPRHHLVLLSMEAGDTASIRELSGYYVEHAPPEATELIRWRASAALGQRAPYTVTPRHLDSFTDQTLRRIVLESVSFGLRLDDAERALAILFRRSASTYERERTLLLLREYALNRGRPAESLRSMKEMLVANRTEWFQRERRRELVYHALYWDADEEAGAQAARELAQLGDTPAAVGIEDLAEQARDRCVLAQWQLSGNDPRMARRAIGFLNHAESRLPRPEATRARACAALLEAMLASAEQRPDVLPLVDRLDSLHMLALPNLINEAVWFCAGNIVSARIRSANGDLSGALAAIRRRGEPGDQKILLSTYLKEEGRLSVLTGDTAGAIRAYRHFLTLRSNPAPSLTPQRDSISHELRLLSRSGSAVSLAR